jgi:hypothetical protein
MGLLTAIIIAVIGTAMILMLNSMPADSVSKFIPICWIPGADCANRYQSLKMYLLLAVVILCVWFIPF